MSSRLHTTCDPRARVGHVLRRLYDGRESRRMPMRGAADYFGPAQGRVRQHRWVIENHMRRSPIGIRSKRRVRAPSRALAADSRKRSTTSGRPTQPTELGARILEAAQDTGLDEYTLGVALQSLLPAGALTRLLYHDVRTLRVEHLERIALVCFCEVLWLQGVETVKRLDGAIPRGVITARTLGASEDAIRAIRERAPPESVEWSDHDWTTLFLAETRRREAEGPPPSSSRSR